MNINKSNYPPESHRPYIRPLHSVVYALLLLCIGSSCTDEWDENRSGQGKGGTATLELSLSIPPMIETKAVICEADSASEARKAGFYYEMQVQTTDTTATDSMHVATKAASSIQKLKNVYAFLFNSNNEFIGRASFKGEVDITKSLKLTFDVSTSNASATNCRLVIIANDADALTNYESNPTFDSFSGNYATFQEIQLTSGITADTDIPYVGSVTSINLDDGNYTLSTPVPLYRMLAKIVLNNETFDIDGGPARNSINLYRAGNKYFGTPNDNGNGYDGTGDTPTTAGRYLTDATPGVNGEKNIWYVGENIKLENDTTNAAYIELGTEVIDRSNKLENVGVGEEYIPSGGEAYKYKVYLTGNALRRNNVYTVRVNVSGPLAYHQTLAFTPGSNVSNEFTGVHGGLNIGMFGGAVGYTSETSALKIKGSYTKYLLIQPNTSETTEMDNVTAVWGPTGTIYQTVPLKYWDYTYIKSITMNGLVGGMSVSPGSVYNYCNGLTIGEVQKGTWYPPTQTQLQAIWTVLANIQNSYYLNFDKKVYVASTEEDEKLARGVNLSNGQVSYCARATASSVRCVRDLEL